jgi:hypothetical protein
LGCTPPSRSTCTSTTFSLLNHQVELRLGTRFGASIRSTNLLPERAGLTRPVPDRARPGVGFPGTAAVRCRRSRDDLPGEREVGDAAGRGHRLDVVGSLEGLSSSSSTPVGRTRRSGRHAFFSEVDVATWTVAAVFAYEYQRILRHQRGINADVDVETYSRCRVTVTSTRNAPLLPDLSPSCPCAPRRPASPGHKPLFGLVKASLRLTSAGGGRA